MRKKLMEMLEARKDDMVQILRYLHENPELSFKEEKTAQYIVDFRVMHACGHDGHTAYLMVLADCLIQLKSDPSRKSIVDSGALDDVENIFGIHLLPMAPAGNVGYHSGFSMAGRSYLKLGIQGIGGHGSSPHLANDTIVAGSHFVTAVQSIISRRINPFDMGVITIGSFDGKGTFNVIRDRVELEGDIRYLNMDTKEIIEKEVRRIVSGIEEQFGVSCELTYTSDYPPLYNDPAVTKMVKESLEGANDRDIKEVVEYPMMSLSEDFAYYLEKIPGCYFYIGCTPKGVEKPYFNHNPKFDIDEDALIVAAKAVGYVICGYYGLE